MKLDYESGIRVIRTIHQWDRSGGGGSCDCACCTEERERNKARMAEMGKSTAYLEMSRYAPFYVLRLTSIIYDDEHRKLLIALVDHEMKWLQSVVPALFTQEPAESVELENRTYTLRDFEELKFVLDVVTTAELGSEFFED